MIDPYLQQIIAGMAASGFRLPDPFEATAMRAVMDNPMPAPPVEIAERRDVTIDTPGRAIAARLYHPAPGEIRPVVLFFHGGGWVIGTVGTHDALAASLAVRSGCAVLSVDYRLAPEHPFPAATDDCVAVAEALPRIAASLGVRPDGFAVAGDSAGGNLAAVAALRLTGSANAPVHQLLFYPVIEARFDTPSYAAASSEGFLPPAMMHWFWDQYVPDAGQRAHPHVSPIHADSLAGLPPATIILAGNDPLHDEGAAYAEALRAAGVPVALHDYEGGIHGFASMFAMVPIADEAVGIAATELAKALKSA